AKHALFVRVGEGPGDRRAAEMLVRAEPFVAVRGDLPASLSNAIAEVRFVPFSRHERRIEMADALQTCDTHGPRTDDDIHFLQPAPIENPIADRALQAAPVDEIVP